MMLELPSNDILYGLNWRQIWLNNHTDVPICNQCVWDNKDSAPAVIENCSPDPDSTCRSSLSRPQTVWLLIFPLPPSDQHTTITGTYAEPAFLRKRNRYPLRPPMNSGLTPLASQTCQVIYSQFGLAIHQNDHQARRRFVEWAQNEIAVVPDFHKRILFNDEAHFWLNGYVNKQNCRIWSEANPQVYVETPLHPEKLTVWCALWAGGIIGPYFKNDEGHNVTVNGDRYRAMITIFSFLN
ncbi:uncharacterized protein TNCV_641261 [Trichonephila clavipes]|nr:uncharacterized protein TNCV_641261 [Trichonephila clavipes]